METTRPPENVTVRMAARVIAKLAAAGSEAEGWRVETGRTDAHRKVMRYRLGRADALAAVAAMEAAQPSARIEPVKRFGYRG